MIKPSGEWLTKSIDYPISPLPDTNHDRRSHQPAPHTNIHRKRKHERQQHPTFHPLNQRRPHYHARQFPRPDLRRLIIGLLLRNRSYIEQDEIIDMECRLEKGHAQQALRGHIPARGNADGKEGIDPEVR